MLVGLDFGTGRIRAVAVDPAGHIIADAAEPTPTHHPRPGWAEYDPGELWQTVCRVLRRLVDALGPSRPVLGLAVGSMGEAGVLLGEDGRELGPVIAWYCSRTIPEQELIRKLLGDDYVFATTGVTVSHTFSLAKILWWRRNHPEVFAKARRWLNMADWVAYRLTGEARAECTLASRTNALDTNRRAWSEELLGRVELDTRLFAPLIANGAPVGRISARAASETGLGQGTIVAAGGHDHVISTLAAGTDEPGVLLDSIGTAEALILANEKAVFADQFRRGGYQQSLLCVGAPRYHLFCGLIAGGGAVEWFRGLTGGMPYDALVAAAGDVAAGSNGVCFLPQLWGGDQPYASPHARAGFVGIAGDCGPGALFRSVLEGLSMTARLSIEGMTGIADVTPVHRIRVIGGGTRNELWMKIKASVYGRPIEVTPLSEATCLSAAILAGLGAGVYATAAEARKAMADGLGPVRVVEPDPAWQAAYERLYTEIYAHLPATLAATHEALARYRERPV